MFSPTSLDQFAKCISLQPQLICWLPRGMIKPTKRPLDQPTTDPSNEMCDTSSAPISMVFPYGPSSIQSKSAGYARANQIWACRFVWHTRHAYIQSSEAKEGESALPWWNGAAVSAPSDKHSSPQCGSLSPTRTWITVSRHRWMDRWTNKRREP